VGQYIFADSGLNMYFEHRVNVNWYDRVWPARKKSFEVRMVNHHNKKYYRTLLDSMNKEEATEFVLAAVKEAIEDTRRTRQRVEKTLELIAARHMSS
jgi:hypothetical protein